jgi:hypothetical protein
MRGKAHRAQAPPILGVNRAGPAAVRSCSLHGYPARRGRRLSRGNSLLCGITFWHRLPLFLRDRPASGGSGKRRPGR